MEISNFSIMCATVRIINKAITITIDDYYDEMEKYFLAIFTEALTEEEVNCLYNVLNQILFSMIKHGLICTSITQDIEISLALSQNSSHKAFAEKLLELEIIAKDIYDFETIVIRNNKR